MLTTTQFDDPDIALAKKAGAGDLQAFREIYERHHRRVYGLVLRLAADHDAAQDVTQEVFIQLWKNLERFRGESKFSTWLHTVATRVAITELRKQTKRLSKLQLAGENQAQFEQQLVQEDSADLNQLDHLVKRLPLQMRWVFVLHCLEGMRHEDVAEELGIAVGTSKAQVFRARTLLEEWLSYDNA
ncbi:MAG: RNA polymerase subunit sigma-70 [Idiomarina sp.]|uniref:RNA polymerase subunit sigma-70 n=1 Tax=Pseudidiomarina marina TaxID=502366 RepID=A0A432YLL0_9GAMM|nr:MAG: RNA polymerase subunit sigma-70 [Idiomarina sp.]RUO61725.1 RNA polymerase subunit sigma-70 [Pseudidiomarina marina]